MSFTTKIFTNHKKQSNWRDSVNVRIDRPLHEDMIAMCVVRRKTLRDLVEEYMILGLEKDKKILSKPTGLLSLFRRS